MWELFKGKINFFASHVHSCSGDRWQAHAIAHEHDHILRVIVVLLPAEKLLQNALAFLQPELACDFLLTLECQRCWQGFAAFVEQAFVMIFVREVICGDRNFTITINIFTIFLSLTFC